MTRRLSAAETVLRDLGIVEPEEIDVEAIAWHLSAKVRYRSLHSCEARLVGRGIAPSSASTIGRILGAGGSRSAMSSATGSITAVAA